MPKHECLVTIDTRESKLAPMIGECVGFSVKTMDCGDIAFTVDGKLVAVGERKEVNDMVSSILDGRYTDQRSRLIELRKANPGLLVFYLFEGNIYRDIEWSRFKTLRPTAITSLWHENTMLLGLFNVFTDDIRGTLEWVSTAQRHYIDHGSPERNVILSNPARHAKVTKVKETVNAKVGMLTAINGVTFDTATMIFQSYKTLDRLMRAFKQLDSEEARCKMLENINRSDEQKAQRIGPALSEKIYRSLFSLPEQAKEVRKRPVKVISAADLDEPQPIRVRKRPDAPRPRKRNVLRDDSPKRSPPRAIISVD